jgi:hypothetical protein
MRWIAGIVAAAVVLTGCATPTRMMRMGPLPAGEPLITLIVSEDRTVVRQECAGVPSVGAILGCHVWRPLTLPGGAEARLVKIVRFTDALPSQLAFEIDAHELCHAIAALQPIDDPCHDDNGGVIRAAAGAAMRWR